MTRVPSDRGGGAALFMLASVLCYSFVPLLIVMAGGVERPFMFNSLYRLCASLGGLFFLLLTCRDLLLDSRVLRLLRRRACRWDFPLLCLPYFGYTAFAWSATLVDVSLTTVIVESWPLFYVPLAERLLRQQGRYLRPTLFRMIPVLLAFGGFVMVVSSHTGGIGRLGALDGASLLGLGLALLGSFSSTSSAYQVRWSGDLRVELRSLLPVVSEYRLELFGMMLVFTLGSLVSSLINLAGEAAVVGRIGLSFPSLREALLVGLLGGLLLDVLGTLGQRTAVYRALNLAVNALAYAIPLFSLAWIWLFWRIGVARPGYLLMGALMVVGANLLISFVPEWGALWKRWLPGRPVG